jgi:ferredoxin
MWDESACSLCGDCLTRCQYVEYDQDQAEHDIKLLIAGEKADILTSCIDCMACSSVFCPTGADPFDLILKMQEKTGLSPLAHDEHSCLTRPQFGGPSELLVGTADRPAFSFCVAEPYVPPGTVSGKLWDGMTLAKGPEYFCYYDMLRHSVENVTRIHAQKFVDSLESIGRDVVLMHDDCYAMLDNKVKDYGIKVPFRYIHMLDYLRDFLRDHQSSITKLDKVVACQIPCAAKFSPGRYALLDEILDLIGVVRPERLYDRENSLCCFAGVASTFPELATERRAANLNDAMGVGAEAVISFCPGCDWALRTPSAEAGAPMLFITQLCSIALGDMPWPELDLDKEFAAVDSRNLE